MRPEAFDDKGQTYQDHESPEDLRCAVPVGLVAEKPPYSNEQDQERQHHLLYHQYPRSLVSLVPTAPTTASTTSLKALP